jgi:hypothetical protein
MAFPFLPLTAVINISSCEEGNLSACCTSQKHQNSKKSTNDIIMIVMAMILAVEVFNNIQNSTTDTHICRN